MVAKIKPFSLFFELSRVPSDIFVSESGGELSPSTLWINKEAIGIIDAIRRQNLAGKIRINKLYRTPLESYIKWMNNGKQSHIAAPPGLSGHNYGLSIDVATFATKKALGLDNADFISMLSSIGFHGIKSEHWHFNFLYSLPNPYFLGFFEKIPAASKSGFKHDLFISRFSSGISMPFKSVKEIQKFLGLEADGNIGPKTFIASTMLLISRSGELPVDDVSKQSLVVDLAKVWL